ncbi:MAG: hypothetical protein IT220_06110 [Flavobacteriaceae bacterium]|nr:hypothetical protein [Flavobacteriaceae bacterium]
MAKDYHLIKKMIISFEAALKFGILLIAFLALIWIKNDNNLISIFFSFLLLVFYLFKFFTFRFVIDIELNENKLIVTESSYFFRIKKREFDIQSIKHIYYSNKTGFSLGDILINFHHSQSFLSIIIFKSNSEKHLKSQTIIKKIILTNHIQSNLLESEPSKIEDSIFDNFKLSQKISEIEQGIGIFIFLVFALTYLVFDFIETNFFMIFIPLIFSLTKNIKTNRLFEITREYDIITLWILKGSSIYTHNFNFNKLKSINYNMKVLLMNGEIDIVLDENEQFIYPINLPNRNKLFKKIKALREEFRNEKNAGNSLQ